MIPDPNKHRIETGPLQIGYDLPGLFLRGDDCLGHRMYLNEIEVFLQKLYKDSQDFEIGIMIMRIQNLNELFLSVSKNKNIKE